MLKKGCKIMNIDLYVNNSATNVINKDIDLITSLTGSHLKKNTDNYNLEIVISYTDNYNKCNYVYIPHFNRYYYVTSIEYSQQTIILHCQCDVLMSFKSIILASSQIVIAQEKKGDMYLASANWEEDSRQYVRNIYFNEDHFDKTNDSYLLAVMS